MKPPWPIIPLADVLRHRKEFVRVDDAGTYKRCRVQLHAKGIVLRDLIEGASLKTKDQQICRANEFLVAEIDAKMGGYGIVPPDLDGAIVSSHYFLFEINSAKLDCAFLGYFVKTPTFFKQVAAQGTTNYAAIRPSHVLAYRIPLPPLEEQRRIVVTIDELAAKISEARQLRLHASDATDRIVPRAVTDIFSNGRDHTWTAGCLGDFIIHDCYGTSEKTHDEPIGTPILRMGNIQDGTLHPRDLRYLPLADKDREKWLLRRNDLLVNRTNSAELVGKCAVFDLDGEFGFASYLIRIRLDLERAEPRLVARYINSPLGREYMFRERKQMTGQANVNSKKLRALPICLPPLAKQRRIAAFLDDLQKKVDDLNALQTHACAKLDALLPDSLDRAFKGCL